MFAYLIGAVLAAAAIHIARTGERTARRIGELVLLYVLVGYCGIPMVAVSVAALAVPDRVADVLGFAAGNPFQAFVGVAYLGMSIVAVLALRYRGAYLIAPAVCWSVFFAGATVIHIRHAAGSGGLTHGGMLGIFATHGLISVLLAGALVASGLARKR